MVDDERGPESVPEGRRAADERDEPGREDPGTSDAPAEGVLTLVCLTCGSEYFFADTDPPGGISCEKCGSTVFRSFFSPDEDDEVAQDFEDSTHRDLDTDDAEGDVLPGDVLDLNLE